MSDRQAPISNPSGDGPGGRTAQRRRTRNAIVAATRELVAEGRTPSIDEIAAAADVSRRTIYMYFPTVDQLVLDAASGLLAQEVVDAALDPDAHDDAVTRADALARAFVELSPRTLPLGRKIIALTVDTAPSEQTDPTMRRGYRRIEWIERALEPLRSDVSTEQYERLVSALAVMLGWEALVVLEDVRALDGERVTQVMTWAVRTLVEATLAEAER